MIEGDAVERSGCILIDDCTRKCRSSFMAEGRDLSAEGSGFGCSSQHGDGDFREAEGSECSRFPLRAAALFASPSSRILLSVALIRSGGMPSGKPLSFGAMSDIPSSKLDGGLGGSRESKVSGSCT